MPLLDIRRLAPGFTEYKVTSDANNYGLMACVVLFAHSIVSTCTQLVQGGHSFMKLLAMFYRQPRLGDVSFGCRRASSVQLVIVLISHIMSVLACADNELGCCTNICVLLGLCNKIRVSYCDQSPCLTVAVHFALRPIQHKLL